MRYHPNSGPFKRLKRLRWGHVHGAKIMLPYNGKMISIPVNARMTRVIVATPKDPTHWSVEFAGQERLAIACTLRVDTLGINEIFWFDNEDGQTLWKLTLGRGNPKYGLRQLGIAREVHDPSICAFYKVEHVALAADKEDDDKYRIVRGAVKGHRRLSVTAKLASAQEAA